MVLSPFAVFLSVLANRALRLLTGCRPAQPCFDGLLDELFAAWPLDAGEMGPRAARAAA